VASGYDGNKIKVAPDAVDLKIFDINIAKEEAREKLDLPQDKIILGYSGNFKTMGEEKGISMILKVVENLKNKIPNIIFVGIGGNEADIKKYQSQADETGIGYNVKLLPRVNLTDLAIYQKAFDILLMPYPNTLHYRFYMSPLKMFEYMTAQRPIIATDLPSVREVLNEDNAFFVPADNIDRLAETILCIVENPELVQRKANQAYQDVRNYTWEKRVKKIIDFIEIR